nr:hypothetical protein [uncultured Anaerostipes sp.]
MQEKKGGESVTREEGLAYRRECPYDAMGDYSVLLEKDKQNGENGKTGIPLLDVSAKQVK